jgi:glycerol uptake facilitator-like aquaporin
MSAEFFGTLGLIICGQSMEAKTEIRIFSNKNKNWTTANTEVTSIDNFSFISLKLFAGDADQPMQMILMGGMDYFNKK